MMIGVPISTRRRYRARTRNLISLHNHQRLNRDRGNTAERRGRTPGGMCRVEHPADDVRPRTSQGRGPMLTQNFNNVRQEPRSIAANNLSQKIAALPAMWYQKRRFYL